MTSWSALDKIKHQNEADAAESLMGDIGFGHDQITHIDSHAVEIVKKARQNARRKGLMENFLEEFGLSNKEGLALMCLAEALLRVPDSRTADKLIAEKISSGKWDEHYGQSDSWLVNASTIGLMLTGRVVDVDEKARKNIDGFMRDLTRKAGAPVIRSAMMQAMRIMGEQFVVGRTVEEAIKRSERLGLLQPVGLCSFDMLGEGARTNKDAERYYKAYQHAIEALGKPRGRGEPDVIKPENVNGISVKLSALHPRFDPLHEQIVMDELYPRLLDLAQMAAKANVNMCIDAEEADRLILSLKLLEKLCYEDSLGDWTGLGLAVQAYQKRSRLLCKMVGELAKESGRRIMVRLVKGAYWDTEIKHSQVEGHLDYPVWSRKSTTDLAYLACARILLEAGEDIYAQFATHNAHAVSAIQEMTSQYEVDFEFQRLHGMGEALYSAVDRKQRVRIYAPVGRHEDLLPYLVRRLLENGANTSFVHKFLDDDVAPETVAKSPFSTMAPSRHSEIPRPVDIFGTDRSNSLGLDITIDEVRADLEKRVAEFKPMKAGPILDGKAKTSGAENVHAPATGHVIGQVANASESDVKQAHESAVQTQKAWNELGGGTRAKILRSMSDALENNMRDLVALMAHEGGKCFADSVAEVREAVDFLRFYAGQAEEHFGEQEDLPGPTGETNRFSMTGRGVFVCISPWNFPLAIFTGQIAAALAAGNTVLAKPAEQTPLTAFRAVELFMEAGLPKKVLQLLIGPGTSVGAQLVELPNIAGVCFTGSTATAKIINRTLAEKDGPIPVFIAETGGLNGMFVDTSALREQVIDDVVYSAFNAAGQRCSALRVLFVPQETSDVLISGIEGAMDSLVIGHSGDPATDVGPVIDAEALGNLQDYVVNLPSSMTLRKQCELPDACKDGHFMPPTLIELSSLDDFNSEQFGPILHVIRYKHKDLDRLMAEFAAKNYGLTLGIHSRLDSFAERVRDAVPAGNIYINRNIIGAVVGVQPFGGRGLSGTGPKAGGPHYILRFGNEVAESNNITAQGGDPALLNLDDKTFDAIRGA